MPWLPDEPGLPEEPGLPGDPDDGDELGMDGGEEDVEPLVVAQPASVKAAASASTRHVHVCLRDISPDSVAQGQCTASRSTPDTSTWIVPRDSWFNASRRRATPGPPRRR